MKPPPLTMAQVSQMTGVPIDTLRYWRWHGGDGPRSFKISRRVMYDEREVLDWLGRQREQGRGREGVPSGTQAVQPQPSTGAAS